ncbi:MAG: clostripain-related cysteine peptidase, partial [Anaerolineaceae bacterium]
MGNKKLLIVIAVLLVVCILCACLGTGAYFLFVKGGELDPFANGGNPIVEEAVTPVTEATTEVSAPPTDTPAPVEQQISVPADRQRWLVMLYQDADDEILERDIYFDANEAEYTGSSDRVMVVSQFDRNAGAYDGDGNWSTTRRFVLSANSDLNTLGSPVIADLGEANMGDPETLIDFITWSVSSYPADRYVLILSDHGGGWMGGWSDADNEDAGMSMLEISGALAEGINRSGLRKFDILAFDACLMSQLEALTMIEPYADYAVASAEVVPAIGFAYNAFISQLVQNPAMSPEDFARWMLATYIDQDMRITDDIARQEFLSEAFNYTGQATAAELSAEMTLDTTLAVI